VLTDVSFDWPDGAPALSHVTASFGTARTGLVGANGAGKSTLLRLIAGELAPTAGQIVTSGAVDHLRQGVTRGGHTVSDLLGITAIRQALRAVEDGSADPVHFDTIADGWDVEERARAELAALGLPDDLDRTVTRLSGGEAMLAAIAGIRVRRADIALLDEPTNNLDLDARERLYEVVRAWRGTLIVVSHDLELLDLLDATAELRDGGLQTFGGPYREYRDWLDTQQLAAQQTLRTAEQVLKRERRERIKAEERIAHSERQGRIDRANRRYVPAAINDRRNSAEKSQGARRGIADAKVEAARQAVQAAERVVRDDDAIRVDLPDPRVPRGRRIAELRGAGRSSGYAIRGPERVGLIGPNGAGKTTLVQALLRAVPVRAGYLPQRIVLDDDATVLDLVRRGAPEVPLPTLRNRLARLLIRGAMVDRPVRSLSGGERFRVAFASLVLADPPPDLLVLDEPTNDLDIPSVDQLVQALAGFRGALLVVSHHRRFLGRLDLDVVLHLGPDGTLTQIR
jgi:ATPase subunit of ABC transporter with duplicated ATPase domains